MNKKLAPKASRCAFVLCAGLLASCAQTPVPQLEVSDVPIDWRGAVVEEGPVWPNTDWWTNFGSDELVEFIDLVKANNLDYATVVRNLEQARLTLQEANVALFPSPSGSIRTGVSTQRSQVGDGPAINTGSTQPFSVSLSASYGNIFNIPLNHQSALYQYESQLAQNSQAALSILAQATLAYFDLLSLRDSIEVTRSNLEVIRTSLTFTEARVRAGLVLPIDQLQQEIQLRNAELSLERQLLAEVQARAAMALLIGRSFDNDFDIEGQTLEGIIVPEVRPGLPSELLTRRPDLVQAEINLRNAAINVDRARLAFLPSISLSAGANTSSPSLVDFVSSPAQTSFNISASLAQTLFDNGGRKRTLESRRIALESQLASYRDTIINAFIQVNNTLDNLALLRIQSDVVEGNLRRAEEQHRIAQVRYEAGTIDSLDLLNAQQTLFSERSNVLSFRATQLSTIVNFYVALGGGWESGEVLLEQPEYQASAN